jgi:hypothetical protein
VSDAVIFPDHSETGVKTRKFAGTLACAGAAAVLGVPFVPSPAGAADSYHLSCDTTGATGDVTFQWSNGAVGLRHRTRVGYSGSSTIMTYVDWSRAVVNSSHVRGLKEGSTRAFPWSTGTGRDRSTT